MLHLSSWMTTLPMMLIGMTGILLVIGFIFLGKTFAIKTTYATVLLSGELLAFEKLTPQTHPLSNEPMLELIFAIALPAISSAPIRCQ